VATRRAKIRYDVSMLRLSRLAVLLALFSVGHAWAGTRYTVLHVADLTAMLAKPGAQVAIFDANVESTRTYVGIIPGAHLLPLSDNDDLLKRLPADKDRPVVFYCANTYCSASEQAAERAIAAGYASVGVLVDGIYGWRKAGQPVRKLKPAPTALAPAQVLAMQQKDEAVVVDVREGEERHEVIAGAAWMPMSDAADPQKWAAFVRGLPRDRTVVLYCAMGVRSKQVAERLREEGLASAWFQGPDQWRAAGLPVKPGPAR
jgi:rhodanese-related sulfurtransferase